jgi:polyisoprenoid-binding protein YceI
MANWIIDAAHSELQFKVKHLMISTVTGTFRTFSGSVESNGDDFSGASVRFEAEVASIDTRSEDRDNHLKSGDFFDAEKFPKLSFVSSSWEKTGEDTYEVKGDLTIKGVTLPVTLEVESGGVQKDPWGNTKAGFDLKGKINRKDFGLTWNAATEAGGVLVGEEVKLIASVQLAQQA